jgi:hypothetical protein
VSDGNQDLASRVAHLESWVEVVMRTLATLGLEGLLIELDEARAAGYSDEYPIPDPRAAGCPRTVTRAG